MLAGGGGLIFAGQYGWGVAYQVASLLMFMFSVAVMFSPTIKVPSPQQTLSMHLIESKALFSRVLKDYSFIASLLTYRLSIFWLEIMLPAFMVSWLGLGVVDVGIIYNIYGMLGLLVGGFVINHYIDLKRLPTTLYQCLCWQVVLCLLFYCSALIKPSYHIINWLVFFECALQGVLGTISTIWLMEKADIKMPAFSFSIWYGISGIGRFFVGPLAVWVIKATGWTGYMLFSVVISIGSAIITWRYMQHDNAYAV
jgi:PAT family beta-lactamase induction signal transducer AmpG